MRCRYYLVETLFHKLWKACVVWDSTVTIRLGRRSHTVKSSRQAFELLTKRWPTSDGRAYISALEACQGVEARTVEENDALVPRHRDYDSLTG
ncbi:DUF982 domain-containing protein [Rhizobium sp. T1473]|uniref:DUF982 domain-containing protein n=1 Tax=unclassified Rhizobium TaxID=2613769 RepID=UPI001CD7581A|nr:DUF982 domain-containing protein [Rhizobium sp. T1473]